MIRNSDQEKSLWLDLAELFFLDTETRPQDFNRVAARVKHIGWDREKTRQALIEQIAPVAGANLGYPIFPSIGSRWEGFNKEMLCAKVEKWQIARATRPKVWLFLLDWHNMRMMRNLGMDQLLEAIDVVG
jgi:hypothetical protein